MAFFESPVARWDAKSELPVVGSLTTEMGLYAALPVTPYSAISALGHLTT